MIFEPTGGTVAHKFVQGIEILLFFHDRPPSPPAFTLPQLPTNEKEVAMRQGKKPTRKQKVRLGQAGLAPENWLVVREKPTGELIILHKYTDRIRVVPALLG
nr:MAG TPA: hypothetical protein [Caudoviricetes sp.]